MIKKFRQDICKNIFLVIYCMFLILFINIKPVNTRYNIIFFLLLLPVAIYSLIFNLRNKSLFFGLINAMNVEMGIAMFFYLYIVKVRISGWRLRLYSARNANIAFSYYLISESILLT